MYIFQPESMTAVKSREKLGGKKYAALFQSSFPIRNAFKTFQPYEYFGSQINFSLATQPEDYHLEPHTYGHACSICMRHFRTSAL